MKNKMKFLILPFAIGVFSLASCDAYPMKWHVISDEKAETVIKQIAKNQEETKETYKLPKITNFNFSYSYSSNGRLLLSNNISCQYDEAGYYMKLETLKYEADAETQYNHSVIYYLKQNEKYYQYNPDEKTSSVILTLEEYNNRINDVSRNTLFKYMAGSLIIDKESTIPDNVLSRTIGLDGKEAYYKKSQRIASETKSSKEGYTSNYYFQMQEDNSIEYYEYSYAPKKYFDITLDNTKECKKEIAYKFIDNYVSTFEGDYRIYDQENKEISCISKCTVTNSIVKDHIVVPE